MNPRPTVAVVGGGIAGLAATYELLHGDAEPVDALLLEASDRLGGKIRTEHRDRFILELGPDSFLSTKPAALELCRELGIKDQLIGTNPDRRTIYLLHEGELVALPSGLTMMAPTNMRELFMTPLLSWRGKLRAAMEPFKPARKRTSDESIEAFISRRFGSELYEGMLEPLMTGIYAGDGARLSLQATFPQLKQWERDLGSVTAGARRLRARRRAAPDGASGPPPSLFLAPKDGLEQLVQALTDQFDRAHVHMNTMISSIHKHAQGYELRTADDRSYVIDGVILAAPSFASADILQDMDPDLATRLNEIEYASTVTVNLGYRAPSPSRALDGYGYLIPRAEGRPALACTITSTKYPDRAPEDGILVRLFLGRAGEGDWVERSDEDLVAAALSEVSATLGMEDAPHLTLVQRWPRGMPQYNVGHLSRIGRIEALAEKHHALELAGAAYDGIGIPDCIASGRAAARTVLAAVQVPSSPA